ncbi:MAG: hypothetical protein IKN73_00610 [Alphaproteobacteria bacterium]|nr:hypothetical protein [Alphaproteobacteria bacterium]
MRKVFAFLLLIFCFMPWVSIADEQNDNIDANSNMNYILSKIKDNELKFNDIAAQVQKKYPDFDWSRFQELEPDAKRIVIKNLLAQEAYSEIRNTFKKDIYSRVKNGVSMDDYGDEIYYYNSSDKLYRTNYVEDNIMAEAKRQNLLHPREGTNWYHFKQQDLPALDKIIASEIAKSPADMYCDKECIKPRSSVDQDWAQQYLKDWKKRLDDYEKNMKKIQDDYEKDGKKSYEEYDASLKEILKKNKKTLYSEQINNIENRIKENDLEKQEFDKKNELERQKFEQEMIERRKEYDEAVARSQKIDIWEMNPYNENCEMVSISCWNVEHIPEKHERLQLSMSKSDENIQEIIYVYDNLEKNEHIESSAFKDCECDNDISDNFQSVTCDCMISFYDMTTDFDKYRRYENLDRIDIKNGKLQDRNEKGVYQHDWAGNHMPVGHISGRTLDLFGSHTLTTNKDE